MSVVPEYRPQLAVPSQWPPVGVDWVHEVCFRGKRTGAVFANGHVRLLDSSSVDWTSLLPDVAALLRQLGCRSAMLDGIITMGNGMVAIDEQQGNLAYHVFDLLELDGIDVTPLPLAERRAQLITLIDGCAECVQVTKQFEIDSVNALRDQGYAGIISKERGAPYRAGLRDSSWQRTMFVTQPPSP